jgi:serine/threonine protein kinase
MAPEIVSRMEYEAQPADIWASGILYYAMLCGKFPFKGSSDQELYDKINKGHFEIPDYVSPDATAFLLKVININPAQRLTAAQILADRYLCNNDNKNVSSQYKKYDGCADLSEYHRIKAKNRLNQTAYLFKSKPKKDHREKCNVTNMAGTINNNFNIINNITEIKYCDEKRAKTFDNGESHDSTKPKYMPKKKLYVKSILIISIFSSLT